MKQSESVKTLLEGFGKAQAEFPTLPKDKNGYNYKYTDLDTVISTLRPILAKHNIGFMQTMTTLENGRWAITTRLFNNAGEWIEDTTPLPDVSLSKGNAAQNVGAAITYMKRYTLCAFLGVSCDEDPDGKPDGNIDINARANAQRQQQQPQPKQKPKSQLAGGESTPAQQKEILEIFEMKFSDGTKIFTQDDFKTVGELRKTKTANEVIQLLYAGAKKRKAEYKASNGDGFPEDIPYEEKPMNEAEQAGANGAFDFGN